MNIKNRITLIFTILTGSLMIVVFGVIYYFSHSYARSEFYQRVEERSHIIAQIHLEKDELSTRLYEEIRKKHVQILPNEQEGIYRVNLSQPRIPEDPVLEKLPDHFFSDIINNKGAHLTIGSTYYAGILYSDNEGDFIVITSADNIYGQAKMSNLLKILIYAFAFTLIALFFLGRYYAGKVLEPISQITDRVNEITATNLHLRLPAGRNKDELSKLSGTFNDMLDRLETTFELQSSFIDNASHELKNPLAAILGETEFTLRKTRSSDEYINALATVEKEAHRLELLINSLLNLAQASQDKQGLIIEPIRADELLFQAKQGVDRVNPRNNITLCLEGLPLDSQFLVLNGSLSLLTIALVNILDNACKFSDNEPVKVKITTSAYYIRISVEDKGIGIPAHHVKNISEPFFRAENARGIKGFGVGLTLAQKIIKMHKGKLNIDSVLSEGTTITVILPNSRK